MAHLTFTHPASRAALASRVALTVERNGGAEALPAQRPAAKLARLYGRPPGAAFLLRFAYGRLRVP